MYHFVKICFCSKGDIHGIGNLRLFYSFFCIFWAVSIQLTNYVKKIVSNIDNRKPSRPFQIEI